MKISSNIAVLVIVSLAALTTAYGQETTVTTPAATTTTTTADAGTSTSVTTANGTITEFTPSTSRIIVRTSTGTPATYSYSKQTTFVDAQGNTISYDTIRAGEPTTLYYTMINGEPVVTKVVVTRTVAAPPVPAKTVTTETTETSTTTKK